MTMHARVGGTWKAIEDPKVNVSGTWKNIDSGHVRVGGAWKEFYSRVTSFYPYQIPYSISAAGAGTLTRDWTGEFDLWHPQKFTISFWFNILNWYEPAYLYFTKIGNFYYSAWIYFEDGKIHIRDYRGSSKSYGKSTNELFSYGSGWHHFCMAVDTTDNISADRTKIYLDGTRITNFSFDFGDYPQNYDETIFISPSLFSMTSDTYLLTYSNGGNGIYGNVAEFHFVYDYAPLASDFGETKESLWIPKAYAGNYGDYGYYLDFSNDANFGEDQSGNGIDFDDEDSDGTQSTDTPTSTEPQ